MVNTALQILLLQPQQEDSEKIVDLVRRAVTAEFPNAIVNTINDLQYVYKPVLETIIEAISSADLIIGNMDGGNQSVTFGLGVALSKQKPILLIVPAGRALSIPIDLYKFRLFVFSLNEPGLFIDSFKAQIKDAVEHEAGEAPEPENNNVFISYSHTDFAFLQRLLVHLRPLQKAGLINMWEDTHLRAGDLWEQEIEKALKRAAVAILLVSADFMASEFIVENELPPLLAKAEAGGTRIIPLIVKPCRFTRDKHLARFQAVNDPRNPLISLSEAAREEIYDKVAMTVELTIGK
jgi:hypothetical protein